MLTGCTACSHTFRGVTSYVEVRRMRRLAQVTAHIPTRAWLISEFEKRAAISDNDGHYIRDKLLLSACITQSFQYNKLILAIMFPI